MSVQRVLICFCIVFCVVSVDFVHADAVCDAPSDAEAISKTRLKLYKGTPDNYTSVDSYITRSENLAETISIEKNTVLYIHGYLENTIASSVTIIPEAYLEKQDVNLLMIDWGNIAISINYIYVSKHVAALGKRLAEAMNKLSHVINFDTFHVVGHSLGAHVGAHLGRNLNGTLHRLTGLDPAFPLFYPSKCHMKPSDAENVVAIHTDGGFFGTPSDTAKVDFYPNRGVRPQPGCALVPTEIPCSHQRSIKFYVESVRNGKAFPAHRCSPMLDETFIGPEVYFGDSVPNTATGQYCFSTRASAPYSKNV